MSKAAMRSSARGLAAVTVVLIALIVAGCGSSGTPVSSSSSSSAATVAGFSWLTPAPPPPGWTTARVPSGATIAFPPGWHLIRGDRGTATAALFDARGHFLGYLNLTPRQGSETLSDWAAFRLRHNAQEGDRDVRADGAAANLRFGTGRGSCVRDTYTTSIDAHYEEIACLVGGGHAAFVVVGAAPVEHWGAEQVVIEREIAAMTT